MAQHAVRGKSPATWGVVAVLLTVAIAGTLLVPIYARSLPKLGAFPFFYWFQLIWVPVAAILCWISYLLLKIKPPRSTRPPSTRPPSTGPHNGGGAWR